MDACALLTASSYLLARFFLTETWQVTFWALLSSVSVFNTSLTAAAQMACDFNRTELNLNVLSLPVGMCNCVVEVNIAK